MEIKRTKPKIRHLNQMKIVLYDQEWAKTAPNLKLYYVYRGIKRRGELRYDITVIPPKMLGKEFVKTKGNRNSNNFPELYTVLKGKGIILMQKMEKKIVKNIVGVRLKKGDWITVPPDYYAILINPSKKNLKTGNWVSEKNKNIYEDLEKMKGACYFYTKSGWIKNKNYKKNLKIKFKKPKKSAPKNLDFLKGT